MKYAPETRNPILNERRVDAGKTVDIERIVIRVLPPPPKIYRRPNQVTGFDGFNQNHVADKVIESLHANGSRGHIPRSTFSGISGGFLRPSFSPTGIIESPDETYGVIWMWVKTHSHAVGTLKYELVCGRFDAQALKFDTFNGECVGIYGEVPIRINNVVLLDVQHLYEQGRRETRERLRYNCASDLIADPNYSGFRSSNVLFEQTPTTTFTKYMTDANSFGDEAPIAGSSLVTQKTKPIEQSLSNPSAFVSRIANAVIEGEYLSDVDRLSAVPDPEGYNDLDLMDRNTRMSRCATMTASNVFSKRFAFSDAIDAATLTTNGMGINSGIVHWEDILAVAPRFHDFTSNEAYRDVEVHISSDMIINGGLANNQRYNESSAWANTSLEASMAYMLSHAVLATMGGLGISSIYFHVTNETADSSWVSQIRGDNSLSYVYGDGNVETINRFLTQVEHEIMPDVASTGDGYFNEVYAEVYADILGDVEITLQVNGGSMEVFKLPSTMTSETTPSLTNQSSTFASITATVGSIVDTVTHRKQTESLDVLRSNLQNTTPAGARPKFR